MKNLGTFDGFKDTDILLQDAAEEDTQNKFYFVFLVKTADKQSEVFCTTDYNEAKKFDKDNDKEIWDSFLWENANAYTPDDAFEVGFCLYGGKKVDKAVVLYYNADGNTVIDDDVYDCETKETMDSIVEMHKGIADVKIVTLGERLKFVS